MPHLFNLVSPVGAEALLTASLHCSYSAEGVKDFVLVCVQLHEVHEAQSSSLLRFLPVEVLLFMSAFSSASVSNAGLLRIQSR